MKVRIPSMLRSYTNDEKYVTVSGQTLRDAMNDLERQYAGIRFRFINEHNNIRNTMKIYVNGQIVMDLDVELNENDEIFITQSLAGGSIW